MTARSELAATAADVNMAPSVLETDRSNRRCEEKLGDSFVDNSGVVLTSDGRLAVTVSDSDVTSG